MNKKLLLVAYTGLEGTPREIQTISNSLPTSMLLNPTVNELMNISTQEIDSVWIASHVSKDGIQINDTETLSLEDFAYLLRVVAPEWVLINGCDGYQSLHRLQGMVDVNVIIPRAQTLDDQRAMRMASLLVSEYVRQGDIKKAIQKLSPAGDVYEYHTSIQSVAVDESIMMNLTTIQQKLSQSESERRKMAQRMDKIEVTIRELSENVKRLSEELAERTRIFVILLSILGGLYLIGLFMSMAILWKV